MKNLLLLISLLFIGVAVYPQTQKRINWGITGGFNSGICLIDKFSVDGENVDYPESIYKVGVTGNLFFRFNLDKWYFQAEPEVGLIRGAFDYNFINRYDKPDIAELSWELLSAGISMPVGYYFIKKASNEFNLFAGPKISKIIDSRNVFDIGNNSYSLDYNFKPFSYSVLCGFGAAVSALFFDFRYEFGLTNYIDNIVYSPLDRNDPPFGEMILKSRMNVMSFSIGIIF